MFALGLIEEDLSSETMRSQSLSSAQKLGIFIETIGTSSLQSTVSRVVGDVSKCFGTYARNSLPGQTDDERVVMSRRYFALCGIPNAVGAIDGTHVKIIAPTEWEDRYVNRKGFHSINVSAIANLELKFILLNVALPGKTHYSRPYLVDGRTEAQVRSTEALQKGRVCVERAFGALKRQFLLPHTELQYDPTAAGKIINAAVCLCNLCILTNEAAFDSVEDSASDYGDGGDVQRNLRRRDGAGLCGSTIILEPAETIIFSFTALK